MLHIFKIPQYQQHKRLLQYHPHIQKFRKDTNSQPLEQISQTNLSPQDLVHRVVQTYIAVISQISKQRLSGIKRKKKSRQRKDGRKEYFLGFILSRMPVCLCKQSAIHDL